MVRVSKQKFGRLEIEHIHRKVILGGECVGLTTNEHADLAFGCGSGPYCITPDYYHITILRPTIFSIIIIFYPCLEDKVYGREAD